MSELSQSHVASPAVSRRISTNGSGGIGMCPPSAYRRSPSWSRLAIGATVPVNSLSIQIDVQCDGISARPRSATSAPSSRASSLPLAPPAIALPPPAAAECISGIVAAVRALPRDRPPLHSAGAAAVPGAAHREAAMSGAAALSFDIEQEIVGAIDHAELLLVRLPFVAPFGTSVQTWATKDALLLRLEGSGVTAWGECVADPDPFYSPETTETCHSVIKSFLLPMVEADLPLGEVLRSFRRVRGNAMARAAVENALLDLIAKRRGAPLHEALGFPRRRIMSGISIGIQASTQALLDAVADAVANRYHRVKMKIMRGKDVEWVAAVRERFPTLPLMVDANGDYTLDDADHLRRLDAFGLTMIEQPLGYHDIYQHSLLQPRLATPLCLDESIHDRDDAAAAIALGACRVINIKQGRVGGVLEAVAMAARLRGTRRAGVVRRHGRDGDRARGQHPPADGTRLHSPRRHLRDQALLPRGHRRAGGGARRRRLHRGAGGTGHRRDRRRGARRPARDRARAPVVRGCEEITSSERPAASAAPPGIACIRTAPGKCGGEPRCCSPRDGGGRQCVMPGPNAP